MNRDPGHILFGVTSSACSGVFDAQMQDLRRQGWTCTVVATSDAPALRALWQALKVLVCTRPAITNVAAPSSDPSVPALGLAAAATRVPLRIYTVNDQPSDRQTEELNRTRRLTRTERLSMTAAHQVTSVSADQPGSWHEVYLDAMYQQARGRHTPVLRVLDILGALAGATLAAIPALAVALAVRLRLGSPVLFRQVRPGRDGTPFTLLKFRSMTDAIGPLSQPLTDAERLTPLGDLLRRTSLDELPSLWNILKGDMSLVGPRPLLTRYTPYFTDRERLRLAVRPGLTGWAQTHGRNTSSWDERLRNDVWWVVNRSVTLYLRILGRTLLRVVRGTDVVTDTASTMQNLDDERFGAPAA